MDSFINDYEIDICICPYWRTDDEAAADITEYMATQVASLTACIGMTHYQHEKNKVPFYLDRSWNFNTEWEFDRRFKDDYICYATHALADSHIWSLPDILKIDTIASDVVVNYQHFEEAFPSGRNQQFR